MSFDGCYKYLDTSLQHLKYRKLKCSYYCFIEVILCNIS